MAGVQRAVLEFDLEVQAPWRPRLVAVPDLDAGVPATASPAAPDRPSGAPSPSVPDVRSLRRRAERPRPHPSRRAPSRVGACAPRVAVPAVAVPPARPARSAPDGVTRPGVRRTSPAPRLPAHRSGRAPRREPVVRLTRRARVLGVLLALLVTLAAGSWAGAVLGGGELRLAGDRSVVVRSGDTLWSIASDLGGNGDVRAVIDEIQRLNGLDGGHLQPGQELRLP
jgi:nucleoid-associated protein YgaU